MERLETLLSKSVAYSEFLANKIKKADEDGAVAVADGSVKGVGLKQPDLIKGNMRPYQLIGVHWLVGLYENGLNGILGDEMGLGKTVQSIAMLAHLTGQGVSGPFMVVGPLSTLYNWQNEFKKWAPKMDAVIYHGAKADREALLGAHWRAKDKSSMPVMCAPDRHRYVRGMHRPAGCGSAARHRRAPPSRAQLGAAMCTRGLWCLRPRHPMLTICACAAAPQDHLV